MDPAEVFEAVQKSCNERLTKQSEGNNAKKVKSLHEEILENSNENVNNALDMQIDEIMQL